MSDSKMDVASSPHTLVITREFAATKDLVFRAWTDQTLLARWSCPSGFVIEFGQMDLRPGGTWRCGMRGPDGTLHVARGEYREIRSPDRLEMTHGWENEQGQPGHVTRVTVELTESHGVTTMRFTQTGFKSVESRDGHRHGWTESFDKLGEQLNGTEPSSSGGDSEREITLSRVFAAPRERVWKAWTDPSHITKWWGPRGFSTTTQHMKVEPGGEWRYVMHGPDGRDYQNLITYREVVYPERLVYKHGGDVECEPVNFSVTVTFEPIGPKADHTRVTMRSVFATRAARDEVVQKYNAIEGGKQTLSRLAEFVEPAPSAATQSSSGAFVYRRVFRAPRELVFKVWTQRDHLMKWFGPKGVSLSACTLDFRVGGALHYCMQFNENEQHWGKWLFTEIDPPQRLVFMISFADEHGAVIRNPWTPDWPLEMRSVVTFDEHAGVGKGTLVTVEWSPHNSTPAERKEFDDGRASMDAGWTGTMEQLEAYLASLPDRLDRERSESC